MFLIQISEDLWNNVRQKISFIALKRELDEYKYKIGIVNGTKIVILWIHLLYSEIVKAV